MAEILSKCMEKIKNNPRLSQNLLVLNKNKRVYTPNFTGEKPTATVAEHDQNYIYLEGSYDYSAAVPWSDLLESFKLNNNCQPGSLRKS